LQQVVNDQELSDFQKRGELQNNNWPLS